MMASFDGPVDNAVYLCRETGEIYWPSDSRDNPDALPDHMEDGAKYIRVPGKRDLNLGRRLVMSFVGEYLPEDVDQVRGFFDRRGAYARFKGLLAERGVLDRWYDFEAKAEERALRAWCKENAIPLSD